MNSSVKTESVTPVEFFQTFHLEHYLYLHTGKNISSGSSHSTGWAKKVIHLVHVLHCTRGITFFGPPGIILNKGRGG